MQLQPRTFPHQPKLRAPYAPALYPPKRVLDVGMKRAMICPKTRAIFLLVANKLVDGTDNLVQGERRCCLPSDAKSV